MARRFIYGWVFFLWRSKCPNPYTYADQRSNFFCNSDPNVIALYRKNRLCELRQHG